MHFLVCIGGEHYSRDTLKLGIQLASALQADLSILYVRPRVSSQFKSELRISRQKLEEWDLETPEVRVMKVVEGMLLEQEFLRTVNGTVDVRHLPKPGVRGAYEYHLYGSGGENVRIRVREGDVVHSIISETSEIHHDLVVVGAPREGGRLVRQIIQYIETSVLIVRNPGWDYRLLLCLDDSRSAQKAAEFAARAARLLQTSIDILCIHAYPWDEHKALEVAERAQRFFKRAQIESTVRVRRGPVERTILSEAEPDHLVVIGTSERSSLSQILFGSTPVRVGRQGNTPVLVVK